jgi:hypothetical protein
MIIAEPENLERESATKALKSPVPSQDPKRIHFHFNHSHAH